MKGRCTGTNGPMGDDEKAEPMQWVGGETPRRSAVKYSAHPPAT